MARQFRITVARLGRLAALCGAAAAVVGAAAPVTAAQVEDPHSQQFSVAWSDDSAKSDHKNGSDANPSFTPVTLEDGNAVANFSQDGLDSLRLNGVEQVKAQTFYYRVGSSGPERLLGSLKLASLMVSDTDVDSPNHNILRETYDGAGFTAGVTYTLIGGGGADPASLTEAVTIANTDSAALDFHLFEYDKFTPAGSVVNTAQIVEGNEGDVLGPNGSSGQVVVNPDADHFQVGLNGSILNSLNDANPTTLSDFAGPLTGKTEFALEFDRGIAGHETFDLDKQKTFTPAAVPLPTAAWSGLATLAALGITAGFRRRRIA